MPFIRTVVPAEFSRERQISIVRGIHNALVDAIGMPTEELFNLITTFPPEAFFFDREFGGVRRSDHVVVIEITLRRGRSDAMKKALYRSIADNLARAADVRGDDVYIFLHENDYSDWSVGHGLFAMALVPQRGAERA